MPKEVLDSAEKTLSELEKQEKKAPTKTMENISKPAKPFNTKEGTVESDGSIQLSLFQLDDPTLSSIRDKLKTADLNNMTPLQAFDLLRSMKEELGI
jgi:DNA mismatch repair protein MutS